MTYFSGPDPSGARPRLFGGRRHSLTTITIATTIGTPADRNVGSWIRSRGEPPGGPEATPATPKLPEAAHEPSAAIGSVGLDSITCATHGPGGLGSWIDIDSWRPSSDARATESRYSATKSSRNARHAPPMNPAISSRVLPSGATK